MPTPESFEDLLATALRVLDEEGERGVERLCAAHPEHAARLRVELGALRDVGLAGTLPAAGTAPGAPSASRQPPDLVPFELKRLLGTGGMGEVWLAEQHTPIRRTVALKLIRGGARAQELLARFRTERQALSMMTHEGIARVLEAGEARDGSPYFVMEYVDGQPITEYCTHRDLGIRERVELLAAVCDAVQHAHQRGVIHRDLKPGNVLVTERDGRPLPKVIDFGLAKGIDRTLEQEMLVTRAGVIVGTPEYMSPEQAAADSGHLDTRTDVYSLGVILYELLTGARPFSAAGGDSSSLLELLRRIREDDPARPSTRAAAAAGGRSAGSRANRRVGSAAWIRTLRGDLDWITMKALAKEPDRRYAAVSELAADLRRHRRGLPVLARPPSAGYALRKFVLRNRVAVAAAAVAVVAGATFVGRELANAAKLAERDARFLKLGLTQQLRTLRQDGIRLLAIAPGQHHDPAQVRAWLDRAREVVAAAPARQRDLDLLRRHGTQDGQGSWGFADVRDQLLHDGLVSLLAELEAFRGPGSVYDAIAARRPWSETVVAATLDAAAERWQAAIAAIADPDTGGAYRGLLVVPQLGLIPLRRDPHSGLWEFRWWTPGGEEPRFDADGRVANLDLCDPILVLLPGGTFSMGSQTVDPDAPGFYAEAFATEQPAHPVSLEPFFIGKYELTQGQWLRWTGFNPSRYPPPQHGRTLGHPVDGVSWNDCSRELGGWGLLLPTEAQWEYAARGGTETPWWTGADDGSLAGRVNLADRSAPAQDVPTPSGFHRDFDDGYGLPAPVDVLAANPFGLHHVLGNLWEWCRDPYRNAYPAANAPGHAAGDGLLTPDQADVDQRVGRGGSYLSLSRLARSAIRLVRAPDTRHPELGVRVARPLLR